MPRTTFSSPIAAVVDHARREAAPTSTSDGLGEGFVGHFFASPSALAEALQPELLEFLHDADIGPLLPESLKAQIRTDFLSKGRDIALLVVARLSDRYQTRLQAATLAFLEARPGASFCFRSPYHQTTSMTRPNRLVPQLPSRYPGRENEVRDIVEALVDPTWRTPSVVLGGPGGIGKTTLGLMVLNEDAVKARYEGRRFWINCETAYSAQDFLESIIVTLSAASTLSNLFPWPLDNVDQDFLELLDKLGDGRDPAIVAFDNLETVFDTQAELVERVLSVMLTQSAVLVTMRGQRRPYIGGLWSWPQSEDSWIQRLPETAWRVAFETHAGRKLGDQEYATIEPVLNQVEGYPLALSLLGRRLTRGEYTAQDLKRAWEIEISRDETPDDTRQTSIRTSIRISLASPFIAKTPSAIDCLLLAAHLPPGFYPPPLRKDSPLLNGLPEWLGRTLCDGEGERADAWAALVRSGLAFINPDAPTRLQLLPPIQEALRHHESPACLSKPARSRLVDAMERVYSAECEGVYPPYRSFDQGDFGKAAKANLLRCGTLDSSAPQYCDNIDAETLAETASLLGLICRHAGHLVSGIALFGDADERHTSLGQEEAAIIARARKKRLQGDLEAQDDQREAVIAIHEEEAKLWDLAARPLDTAYALASAHHSRAWTVWFGNSFEFAAQHIPRQAHKRGEEALQWERSGSAANADRSADQARARALDFQNPVACRKEHLEDAFRLYDEVASVWEQAGDPQRAAANRALAHNDRRWIAERDGRFDDAIRYCEEEASYRDQAGRPTDAACSRAWACARRARMAMHEDRLQHAAEDRIEEASWWGQAHIEGNADLARNEAKVLHRRIAELDRHLDNVAERIDETTSLLGSLQHNIAGPSRPHSSPCGQEIGAGKASKSTFWRL